MLLLSAGELFAEALIQLRRQDRLVLEKFEYSHVVRFSPYIHKLSKDYFIMHGEKYLKVIERK